MVYAISLWIALYGTWLLLSGFYTPFLMGLGAVSCAVVVFIARRMNVIDHEAVPIQLGWRIFTYWPWLIVEIFKANVDVTRRVLAPSLPISPTMIKVKTAQRSDLGKVLYANSITLTPGTVSVDVHEDEITVHAISEEGAADIAEGTMNRKSAAVEGA
ncbi:MAG: Na+/H+ antiporter subunit E [Minwuiales bacterium]|nr:Na+/H+ antiporter subunit E [Minwuiales bacterium]